MEKFKFEEGKKYYGLEGKQQLEELIRQKKAEIFDISSQRTAGAKATGSGSGGNSTDGDFLEKGRLLRLHTGELNSFREQFNSYVLVNPHRDPNKVCMGDFVEAELSYSDGTKERFIIRISGLYQLTNDDLASSVTLNSPISKTIFGKEVGFVGSYTVGNEKINIEVLNKGVTIEDLVKNAGEKDKEETIERSKK